MSRRSAEPEWRGPTVPYDLVKEVVVGFVVILLITVGLAALLSSPDRKPATIKAWAQSDPVDFVTTAAAELDGSSDTAGYGHPYNEVPGAGQSMGPVSLQRFFPVTHPIDPAKDFVLNPLRTSGNSDFVQAADQYDAASADQQSAWLKSYEKRLGKATVSDGNLVLPPGRDGPVDALMSSALRMARSGALDASLESFSDRFYGMDVTKPLMFMGDGGWFPNLAAQDHLQGDQWGMMNETGNYPGQAWLWLYTLWYQVPPFTTSGNADAWIWLIMAVLTAALILVPFIPGVRDIPRWVPVHKLIWRQT